MTKRGLLLCIVCIAWLFPACVTPSAQQKPEKERPRPHLEQQAAPQRDPGRSTDEVLQPVQPKEDDEESEEERKREP